MANAFKNKGKTLSDSTLSTVFTAHSSGAAETVIHSLTVCNTGTAGTINADIVVTDSSPSASYYIAKVAPVPEGSSLVFADIKLNLESGDILKAKSSHASGHLDVFASGLEIT